MKDIVWVMSETILAVHDEQLAQHGGAQGIGDLNIIQSALARPCNLALHEDCDDLARLAAAYAYGIARNHGLVDGNKRTALVTADLFLMLNGHELRSTPAENVLTIIGVADGSLSEDDLTIWFREKITRLEQS